METVRDFNIGNIIFVKYYPKHSRSHTELSPPPLCKTFFFHPFSTFSDTKQRF